MQRTLIALALAAAYAAPAFAATANVDVYGTLKMSVDIVDRDTNGVEDEFQLASNNSRIGFKGAEDLGEGLSLIWQLETRLDLDAGAFNAGQRNTFLGLAHKTLGTLRLGRYDTAYKRATADFDAFADGLGDYNAIMGSVNGAGGFLPVEYQNTDLTQLFNVREANSLTYESPRIAGFQLGASYGQRNEAGATGADAELYSVGVNYVHGPLAVIAAYESQKDSTNRYVATTFGVTTASGTAVGDFDAWKVGAAYQFGDTRIAAFYERIEGENALNFFSPPGILTSSFNEDSQRDAFYVSVAHRMGNVTYKAAYAMAGETEINGAEVGDGAQQWVVGVDYSLSKRTTAFALYTALDNDNAAAYSLGGLSTTGRITGPAGYSPSGLSLGLEHSF